MSQTENRKSDVASLVSLHTYTNGRADVLITGTYGSLTLSVSADGPTVGVRDPERGPGRYKAVAALQANGHLKGWFVAKKGATPREDTLVFFPMRKPRKRPVKRRQAAKSVQEGGLSDGRAYTGESDFRAICSQLSRRSSLGKHLLDAAYRIG